MSEHNSMKTRIANSDIKIYSNHNSFDTILFALEDTTSAAKKALRLIKREVRKNTVREQPYSNTDFLKNIFEKSTMSNYDLRLYSPYAQLDYAPGNASEVKLLMGNSLLNEQVFFIYRDANRRETLRIVEPKFIYKDYFVGKTGSHYRNYKFEKIRYSWRMSGHMGKLALYKLTNTCKSSTDFKSVLTYKLEKVNSHFLRQIIDYSSEDSKYNDPQAWSSSEESACHNSDELEYSFMEGSLHLTDSELQKRNAIFKETMEQTRKRVDELSEVCDVIHQDYTALEKKYNQSSKIRALNALNDGTLYL